MIRQEFDVKSYWKVIVYYNVDYALFSDIFNSLQKVGAASEDIENIYGNMVSGKAKAVTYSNYSKHISVVLFNKPCIYDRIPCNEDVSYIQEADKEQMKRGIF